MGSRKKMGEGSQPERVGKLLERLLRNAVDMDGLEEGAGRVDLTAEVTPVPPAEQTSQGVGRYDFDLAEFPLFSFCKPKLKARGREPLVYTDTITGRDGRPVAREWKAYPGPFGVGGPSTQALFYDLLQLYWEQGASGSQIEFGTLRSLFLRRGERNPGKRDYERMRRDLDILRGYDFHCTNAFWDHRRRAYVDMRWRLFGSVFYFRPDPADADSELPYGFIEVSSVLREVARTRGFFALGFGSKLFHRLRPLEQRLAVYLAKKFVSQAVHRRFVDDLARALPIEAVDPAEARKTLKSAAAGLKAKGVPILAAFRVEKGREGRYLATFKRGQAPAQDPPASRLARTVVTPELAFQVDRIVEAVGSGDDRAWWAQCARRLGGGAVDRALGLLKEARSTGRVRNPGAVLTKFFKDIAAEQGVLLR
jgi:hypothetical protein